MMNCCCPLNCDYYSPSYSSPINLTSLNDIPIIICGTPESNSETIFAKLVNTDVPIDPQHQYDINLTYHINGGPVSNKRFSWQTNEPFCLRKRSNNGKVTKELFISQFGWDDIEDAIRDEIQEAIRKSKQQGSHLGLSTNNDKKNNDDDDDVDIDSRIKIDLSENYHRYTAKYGQFLDHRGDISWKGPGRENEPVFIFVLDIKKYNEYDSYQFNSLSKDDPFYRLFNNILFETDRKYYYKCAAPVLFVINHLSNNDDDDEDDSNYYNCTYDVNELCALLELPNIWDKKKPMFANYDELEMNKIKNVNKVIETQLESFFSDDICKIILDYIPRRVPTEGNCKQNNPQRYRPYRWKVVDTRINNGNNSLQSGFEWLIKELLNTKSSKYYDPIYDEIRPYKDMTSGSGFMAKWANCCINIFCNSCIQHDKCYCCNKACDFWCFLSCDKKPCICCGGEC